MLATLPQVSVVIPVLNEEKNIIRTLETLLSNERYPRSKIEIIFIDGGSTDRSYEIIECFTKQSEINCLVLKNEGKITPKSLNIGIRSARSKIILRADAHALYGTDYIYYSVKNLIDGLGDNIGGASTIRK